MIYIIVPRFGWLAGGCWEERGEVRGEAEKEKGGRGSTKRQQQQPVLSATVGLANKSELGGT